MAKRFTNLRGGSYVIQNCIIGKNLNLTQIRGYATLDVLADMSGADVYDQVSNPLGTQRDLKPVHAREASKYALEAAQFAPDEDPRAFPEILLNVRDTSLVSFSSAGLTNVAFTSLEDDPEQSGLLVDVILDLETLSQPQPQKSPQISRLDGNHRLSRVPAPAEREEGQAFPVVPFAMFVGLSEDQERKLFADINGKQQTMNTSHLAQITMELEGDRLLLDSKTRPLWFAKKLSSEKEGFNGVFHSLVFKGGSKAGVKEKSGYVPPLNLATVRSMVQTSLREMEALVTEEIPPALLDAARSKDKEAQRKVVDAANEFLILFARFWTAVQRNYPEAWADTKKGKYILYTSIGALGLSQLAGTVIEELVREEKVLQDDFDHELRRIRNGGVDLHKDSFKGFAGLAGAKQVFERLIAARVDGSSGLKAVRKDLIGDPTSLLEN